MISQQQAAVEEFGAMSSHHSGPEDECDASVNWPMDLPDASDDQGDDEFLTDPVPEGFGETEPLDSEDLGGWGGYNSDAEDGGDE